MKSHASPAVAATYIGLLGSLLVFILYVAGLSMRGLLLVAIASSLLLPLTLRAIRGRLDLFEPIVLANIALGIMFVGRPLNQLITGETVHLGYDILPTFNETLLVALRGATDQCLHRPGQFPVGHDRTPGLYAEGHDCRRVGQCDSGCPVDSPLGHRRRHHCDRNQLDPVERAAGHPGSAPIGHGRDSQWTNSPTISQEYKGSRALSGIIAALLGVRAAINALLRTSGISANEI